ncbi:hypothetical protein [Lyngbya aestuarii]|uniref:hypothetical protein n=1 Tax=Lyngbya aestuarii TaxID=118322 RepID=UPI00403DF750
MKIWDRGDIVVSLFSDPFLDERPYIGTLSKLSEFLWCVAGTTCVCSFSLLNTTQPGKKINLFLLYSAIGIAVLFLDDVLRIHLILKSIGIPRLLVYLSYGTAAIFYGWSFRRIISYTPYFLLFLAIVLFIISGLVDSLPIPGKGSRAMLEDGTRLLGVINLVLYFKQVCWQATLHSLDKWKS